MAVPKRGLNHYVVDMKKRASANFVPNVYHENFPSTQGFQSKCAVRPIAQHGLS